MADVLYFNGRYTTTDERVLGVEDRGFQFGDAVYEVMPVTMIDSRPVGSGRRGTLTQALQNAFDLAEEASACGTGDEQQPA